MAKTKLVYGVEHFAKYRDNKGIAMNTKTKEERYSIAKGWIAIFPKSAKW